MKYGFKSSRYTVSKHFNVILKPLLKLHSVHFVNPKPNQEHYKMIYGNYLTININNILPFCRFFFLKKYFLLSRLNDVMLIIEWLSALDSTHIKVKGAQLKKSCMETKKEKISVNVHSMCG